MRHIETTPGNHYAVGSNSMVGQVLVQLQENGEQVRIPLTPAEARSLAANLVSHATELEHAKLSPAALEQVELKALRAHWVTQFEPIYRASLVMGAVTCGAAGLSLFAYAWTGGNPDLYNVQFLGLSFLMLLLVTPLISLPHALCQLPSWPRLGQLRKNKALKAAWLKHQGPGSSSC